jgi:hypothetical protein
LVLTRTILEQTKAGLAKWFLAIDLVTSSKCWIWSIKLQRKIGFGSYQTAWLRLHNIDKAMLQLHRAPLAMRVEADETYLGVKPGRAGSGAAGKAIARPVQRVASLSGSARIRITIRHTIWSPTSALPSLRVASGSSPSILASAERRCRRQTAGRLTRARLGTSATGSRAADSRMIRTRAIFFWARLRSATIASRRVRSSAETKGHTI